MNRTYLKTMDSTYQRKAFEVVRYTLTTFYDDTISKREGTNDVVLALGAASIYLQDPHCEGAQLYDHERDEIIMNIWR